MSSNSSVVAVESEGGLGDPAYDQRDGEGSIAGGSVASSKQLADVFQFISIVENEDGSTKAYTCMCCAEKGISQCWTTRSTSNFRKHLSNKHADRYAPTSSQTKLRRYGFKSSKRSRPSSSAPLSSDDKQYADKKLLEWIVNHYQSFSVVEQDDFVEFCGVLREDYDVPSRKTLRARVIKLWEEEKAKARMKLEKDLAGRRCGMTTDMWTSAAKRGYMVVTLHYIDANWDMHDVIIAFIRVLYPHSAERLAEHLIAGIESMSPRLLTSLWAITADNASSNPAMVEQINGGMLQAAVDLAASVLLPLSASQEDPESTAPNDMAQPRDVFLLRCFAHVIQLAVKEGLKSCPALDTAIGHFRDLVEKIHDSPKLQEALSAVCRSLKVPDKSVDLDVITRWNSTWKMVATLLQLKEALVELLRRIRHSHEGYTEFSIAPSDHLAKEIDAITWSVLLDFKNFLTPFQEATVLMSASQYPTLGLVIPVYTLIQRHVDVAIAAESGFRSTHSQRFATKVKEKMDEYEDRVKQTEVVLAAALDPRVKNLLPKFGIPEYEVKSKLLFEWSDNYETAYEDAQMSGNDARAQSQISSSLLAMLEDPEADDADSSTEPFESEVRRWMAHSPMNLSCSSRDVCDWMKVNISMYPRISIMAKDFLGLTSTSVPSEQAFSRAGTTVNCRRTRLGDDSVQAICELQSLLKFNTKRC